MMPSVLWLLTVSSLVCVVYSHVHNQGVSVIRREKRSTMQPYRLQRSKPVTNALATNVLAFAALLNRKPAFQALAKNNYMIRSHGQWYRCVSSCFLHGSIPHMVLNCNALHSLGGAAEPWFGSQRLALIYLAGGVAGNVLSLSLNRAPLSVGASGCIFGLLGAYAASLQHNSDFFAVRGGRDALDPLDVRRMCADGRNRARARIADRQSGSSRRPRWRCRVRLHSGASLGN